jgi:hypothetical protein
MADVKISGLPASTTPLAGTEVLPIVQGGATKQVSVNNLTAGKAVSAASLALTTPLPDSSGGTGLSSLGTGVATFLGTPSSANLAAAVTGETGTGALVFGTNPTFSNTAGASSANFTNSAFQDVVTNYYNASGTVGGKITLQFASDGGAAATNSIVSYGSAMGAGFDNAMEISNASGKIFLTKNGGVSIGNTVDKGAASLNVSGLIYPQQAATASAPAYVIGAIYFDTTLNKLRVGGATAWETITSV